MQKPNVSFIRYPGGKQRLMSQLIQDLPVPSSIKGHFVEPFVGGGAIFFAINPRKAILADINEELIDLYRGIRRNAKEVWNIFRAFPNTKKAYYEIRDSRQQGYKLVDKAARTLYLNRTCFKGMWRHNASGQFNVGYGGQDRRWVINEQVLLDVSRRLQHTYLTSCDFEGIIDSCSKDDFMFLDPPYCPGEKEITHSHYIHSKFNFDDHVRLARALKRASRKRIKWAMTTSSHRDVLQLFQGNRIVHIEKGTGKKPGIMTVNSGEVLICNY